MKKILISVLILALLASPAVAFLYEMKILTREEIKKLTDDELTEIYIEARIEEKASSEFHGAAGFSSSKDYNSRKKLLRFVFELRREMAIREKIVAEAIDEHLD